MSRQSGIFRSSLSLRATLIITSLLAAGLFAPAMPALASGDEHDPRRLERLWRGQWRQFADEYFLYEGQAHVLLNHERGANNSLPYTESRLKAPELELNWKQRYGNVYIKKAKKLSPHEDDVAYALNVLPRLAPGHFGHILSARVVDRIDDQTVRVHDIRYIDTDALERDKNSSFRAVSRQAAQLGASLNVSAEQINEFFFRYRTAIAGLPSRELTITGLSAEQVTLPGGTLEGPIQLALFDRGRGLEAVPMDRIKVGLNEQQFIAMLEARGKSKEQFAMVIADGLDRRLSIQQLRRAIRRYLEDYDPKRTAARLAAAKADKPAADDPQPTPEPDASVADATETATEPAASTDLEADAQEPISEATTASAGTVGEDPRNHRKPKPDTDKYFEDLPEEDEPSENANIFDFGRDL